MQEISDRIRDFYDRLKSYKGTSKYSACYERREDFLSD